MLASPEGGDGRAVGAGPLVEGKHKAWDHNRGSVEDWRMIYSKCNMWPVVADRVA